MRREKTEQELDLLFQRALEKIGVPNENKLCHYLPGEGGGYIHHFTLRKMRQENPSLLAELLNKHILSVSDPQKIAPKRRAPRGSRRHKSLLQLNSAAVERLLGMARSVGDREVIAMLTPSRSLAGCQRELIASIKAGRVDQPLWEAYAALATSRESSPS